METGLGRAASFNYLQCDGGCWHGTRLESIDDFPRRRHLKSHVKVDAHACLTLKKLDCLQLGHVSQADACLTISCA